MKYGAENWRRGEVTLSVEKGIWLSREQPEALCESLRKKRKGGYSEEEGWNRTGSKATEALQASRPPEDWDFTLSYPEAISTI